MNLSNLLDPLAFTHWKATINIVKGSEQVDLSCDDRQVVEKPLALCSWVFMENSRRRCLKWDKKEEKEKERNVFAEHLFLLLSVLL